MSSLVRVLHSACRRHEILVAEARLDRPFEPLAADFYVWIDKVIERPILMPATQSQVPAGREVNSVDRPAAEIKISSLWMIEGFRGVDRKPTGLG